MTAPRSVRAAGDSIRVENRTFTFEGRTYDVRAEKTATGWAVAAYLEGQRASKAFELAARSGGQLSQDVVDAIDELMIAVEDDVRSKQSVAAAAASHGE